MTKNKNSKYLKNVSVFATLSLQCLAQKSTGLLPSKGRTASASWGADSPLGVRGKRWKKITKTFFRLVYQRTAIKSESKLI